ncbi:hypothetical protein ACHAXT_005956 [Thalassiosira profunda]
MRPFLAALALPAAAAFAPRLSAFGGGASLGADAAAARLSPLRASLDAILFDCDGVLADTERDGHRPAFNIAFKENGISEEWGEERYGKLLEVGGGKERMTAHWNEVGWPEQIPEEGRSDKIMELHLRKTDIFMDLIDDGKIPLRPGVLRLVDEAIANGVKLAVCSTSNEKAVSNLVSTLMGPERASKFQVFAGDMVKKKKPAPDVYLMAVNEMGLDKERCVIIEDSHIGVGAAVAAEIACLVTKSSYTANEDFTGAKMIVGELGDDAATGVTLATLTGLLGDDAEEEVEVGTFSPPAWDRAGHVETAGTSWTGARLGDGLPNQPATYTASETVPTSETRSIGVQMEDHVEKGGASWTGARFGQDTPLSTSVASKAVGTRGLGVQMEGHVEKGGASWTGARFGQNTPLSASETSKAVGPRGLGVQMEGHIDKGGTSWTGARFGDENINQAHGYTASETYEFKTKDKSSGAEWDSAAHTEASAGGENDAWSGARFGNGARGRCSPTPSNWHE